jgi:hypothetical protein
MHEIIDKKFYLGPKFGTLFNKKWITISEVLQVSNWPVIYFINYTPTSSLALFITAPSASPVNLNRPICYIS